MYFLLWFAGLLLSINGRVFNYIFRTFFMWQSVIAIMGLLEYTIQWIWRNRQQLRMSWSAVDVFHDAF